MANDISMLSLRTKFIVRWSLAILTLVAGNFGPAVALDMETARENCRNTVGRPFVQACIREMGGPVNRETCRAKASPTVKACVIAALNKANGRANVAIELNKGGKPKDDVAPGNALPAGFVAPPRTIADIASVLDNEKPDAATLAKLKVEAVAEPPKNASTADASDFY